MNYTVKDKNTMSKKKSKFSVEKGAVIDHPTKKGHVLAGSLEAANNYIDEQANKPLIVDTEDAPITYNSDEENKYTMMKMWNNLVKHGMKATQLEFMVFMAHINGKGLAWVQGMLSKQGMFKTIETLEETERVVNQKIKWELSKSKNEGMVAIEQ